jgi:hypothetical protein
MRRRLNMTSRYFWLNLCKCASMQTFKCANEHIKENICTSAHLHIYNLHI